jgi:hypothetical protein
MNLDPDGWSQLPEIGTVIDIVGGSIVYQVGGPYTITHAVHVRNAAGRPGGRVRLRTERGEESSFPLSYIREHGRVRD